MEQTSEFSGPTYDDFPPIEDDIHSEVKLAAAEYLKQEETISRLNAQINAKESHIKKLLSPDEVKGFVHQALPQVNSMDTALQMINHLIAADQLNPNGWFNSITKNQSKNKLQLIQALIEIGLESEM